MRLTDKQFIEVVRDAAPLVYESDTLMSSLIANGGIVVITDRKRFVMVKRDTHPRWEKVEL